MPALQIKDCPQDVYDSLKRCARAEDRSMSQQSVHLLRRYLKMYERLRNEVDDPDAIIFDEAKIPKEPAYRDGLSHSEYVKKREELFERLRNSEPVELPEGMRDIAAVIRNDREERANRIMEIVGAPTRKATAKGENE